MERLLRMTSEYLYAEDLELIRRAYQFTENCQRNKGLYRFSGEPAILHYIEVALKLAEWGMDSRTVSAGILHDVVEDLRIHLTQIRATFGEEVALLVEGMTKLRRFELDPDDGAGTEFVGLFLAAASNIRVVLIKLADRLHNMGTLEYLPADRKSENAAETRQLFIPLAKFLGIGAVQRELENLTFRYTDPKGFETADGYVENIAAAEDEFFERCVERLKTRLSHISPLSVRRRFNSVYETSQLMRSGGNSKKLTGYIEVTVGEERQCYEALGAVHASFHSNNTGFVDTVHHPDASLKRRIQTEVFDDAGNPFRVEIATEEMKRTNEYGIIPLLMAPGSLRRVDFLEARIDEIHRTINEYRMEQERKDRIVFMEMLKSDLLQRDMFVFTPDGQRVSLPAGSTALDLAYLEGEEIGNHFGRAIVNNQEVGPGYVLQTCNQVRVITDEKALPKMEWLMNVNTTLAKYAIMRALKKQSKKEAARTGKENLMKEIKSAGLAYLGDEKHIESSMKPVVDFLGLGTLEGFYEAVGYGQITLKEAVDVLKEQRKRMSLISARELATSLRSHPVFSRVFPPSVVKLKKGACESVMVCELCAPLPGDSIEGSVYGKTLVLHGSNCRRLGRRFIRGKKVGVEWAETEAVLFPVRMKVKMFHRPSFYNELLEIVDERRGAVVASHTDVSVADGLDLMEFILDVPSRSTQEAICDSVLELEDVVAATRL
ncbi:MAG: HD domain-containing protein [bacterium]